MNRTLDRLTDPLDEDELAFYSHQKDGLKRQLEEYREELARLQNQLVLVSVSEEVIEDFATMGETYRTILETSEDFEFWRGLIDDLDVTGTIGIDEENRRYVEFIVFGKTRKREYLQERPDTPQQNDGTQQAARTELFGSFINWVTAA